MEKRTRKLVRVGKSSLAIIIPKPWLVFYKLKYGDELEVITDKVVEIRPIRHTKTEGEAES